MKTVSTLCIKSPIYIRTLISRLLKAFNKITPGDEKERRARQGRYASGEKKKNDFPFNFYIVHFRDNLNSRVHV